MNVFQAQKNLTEMREVVSVDRAEVADAERLEEVVVSECDGLSDMGDALEENLGFASIALSGIQFLPHLLFKFVVAWRGGDVSKVAVESADGFVYRDAVIVENDEDIGFGETQIVESLEGLAAGEGAVADDSDMLAPRIALHFGGYSHAEGCGDRGGAVSGAEGIVWTFGHLGETADTAVGAYGLECIAAAGENLVGIGLVSHIPYQLIVGGIEDIMQSNSKLDGTQTGCQVTGMGRESLHDISAQLVCHFLQLTRGEPFKVGRTVYLTQIHFS